MVDVIQNVILNMTQLIPRNILLLYYTSSFRQGIVLDAILLPGAIESQTRFIIDMYELIKRRKPDH